MQAEIVIDAPLAHVFDVLTSYEQLPELTSRFVESRYLEPAGDGAPRIFTQVRGCVLFFCRSIIRVVRLDMIRDWSITATAEPDLSQVRFGIEQWFLRADDNATVVTYSHEMEPDFWVPPLIGVWAMRRVLRRDAVEVAQRIEALSKPTTD